MLGLFLFEGCYVFLSTMVFCFCFFGQDMDYYNIFHFSAETV